MVDRLYVLDTSPPRRRPLALALIGLVVAATVAVSAWDVTRERAGLDSWISSQAEVVEGVVGDAIGGVFVNLRAAAAFVEQTEPSSAEFDAFIERIDGTANAVGIGYVSILPVEDAERYLDEQIGMNTDLEEIFGLNADGSRKPLDATGRQEYYPIELFTVGDMIRPFVADDSDSKRLGVGLDIGYGPVWRQDVAGAASAEGPALSRFIDVKLDIVTLEQVFFASVPVRAADGSTRGLVAALILEPLLLRHLDNRALDGVQWEVIARGTDPTRVTAPTSRIYPLDMPSANWSLAIAPTDDALQRLRGQPWWVAAAVVALLASLTALSAWLLIDRRSEHTRTARFKQVADDKDRFLASVSHELRTPLTVVSGVANELRDRHTTFSADEETSLLSMLVDESDELAAIVEDLLIAARSDIGKVVIHYAKTDLGADAKRAMHSAGIDAALRGSPAMAWADSQRVGQILRNLLTNARRYGGPSVHFEFTAAGDAVSIVVADTGSSIPAGTRAAMFEAYQSAHTPTQTVRSVGLGLYISRNLARAMGGELEYDHDGTFSRFTLTLQAYRTPATAHGPEPLDGVNVSSTDAPPR